eukprot:Rhum_TRINITY_DN9003_c0_g1::Rhum_TRINITY_DN9003_c0_g1_i2::g.31170::m.31170
MASRRRLACVTLSFAVLLHGGAAVPVSPTRTLIPTATTTLGPATATASLQKPATATVTASLPLATPTLTTTASLYPTATPQPTATASLFATATRVPTPTAILPLSTPTATLNPPRTATASLIVPVTATASLPLPVVFNVVWCAADVDCRQTGDAGATCSRGACVCSGLYRSVTQTAGGDRVSEKKTCTLKGADAQATVTYTAVLAATEATCAAVDVTSGTDTAVTLLIRELAGTEGAVTRPSVSCDEADAKVTLTVSGTISPVAVTKVQATSLSTAAALARSASDTLSKASATSLTVQARTLPLAVSTAWCTGDRDCTGIDFDATCTNARAGCACGRFHSGFDAAPVCAADGADAADQKVDATLAAVVCVRGVSACPTEDTPETNVAAITAWLKQATGAQNVIEVVMACAAQADNAKCSEYDGTTAVMTISAEAQKAPLATVRDLNTGAVAAAFAEHSSAVGTPIVADFVVSPRLVGPGPTLSAQWCAADAACRTRGDTLATCATGTKTCACSHGFGAGGGVSPSVCAEHSTAAVVTVDASVTLCAKSTTTVCGDPVTPVVATNFYRALLGAGPTITEGAVTCATSGAVACPPNGVRVTITAVVASPTAQTGIYSVTARKVTETLRGLAHVLVKNADYSGVHSFVARPLPQAPALAVQWCGSNADCRTRGAAAATCASGKCTCATEGFGHSGTAAVCVKSAAAASMLTTLTAELSLCLGGELTCGRVVASAITTASIAKLMQDSLPGEHRHTVTDMRLVDGCTATAECPLGVYAVRAKVADVLLADSSTVFLSDVNAALRAAEPAVLQGSALVAATLTAGPLPAPPAAGTLTVGWCSDAEACRVRGDAAATCAENSCTCGTSGYSAVGAAPICAEAASTRDAIVVASTVSMQLCLVGPCSSPPTETAVKTFLRASAKGPTEAAVSAYTSTCETGTRAVCGVGFASRLVVSGVVAGVPLADAASVTHAFVEEKLAAASERLNGGKIVAGTLVVSAAVPARELPVPVRWCAADADCTVFGDAGATCASNVCTCGTGFSGVATNEGTAAICASADATDSFAVGLGVSLNLCLAASHQSCGAFANVTDGVSAALQVVFGVSSSVSSQCTQNTVASLCTTSGGVHLVIDATLPPVALSKSTGVLYATVRDALAASEVAIIAAATLPKGKLAFAAKQPPSIVAWCENDAGCRTRGDAVATCVVPTGRCACSDGFGPVTADTATAAVCAEDGSAASTLKVDATVNATLCAEGWSCDTDPTDTVTTGLTAVFTAALGGEEATGVTAACIQDAPASTCAEDKTAVAISAVANTNAAALRWVDARHFKAALAQSSVVKLSSAVFVGASLKIAGLVTPKPVPYCEAEGNECSTVEWCQSNDDCASRGDFASTCLKMEPLGGFGTRCQCSTGFGPLAFAEGDKPASVQETDLLAARALICAPDGANALQYTVTVNVELTLCRGDGETCEGFSPLLPDNYKILAADLEAIFHGNESEIVVACGQGIHAECGVVPPVASRAADLLADGQHVKLKALVKNVPIVSAARGTLDVVSAALAKSNATLFSSATAVKTSFVSKSSTTAAQVVPRVETPAPPTQILNIDQSSPSSCSWCLPAFVIIGGALVACVVIMGAVKK